MDARSSFGPIIRRSLSHRLVSHGVSSPLGHYVRVPVSLVGYSIVYRRVLQAVKRTKPVILLVKLNVEKKIG